jgi:hypothetical protein
MTSAIVRTNPTAGTATTSSVRDNFGFAADEINRLLRANTDKVLATGTNSIVANFSNVPTFVLDDGVRVLIEIANTTTSATPTLNVNGSNAKSIKKSDGSSLAIGDLVGGGYYEFVYDLGEDEWLALNIVFTLDETNLFTTMLGGLYPVGSLLTTTLATDPGTADYFFSGITFGTWEAYAQGRTIVGIASDATLSSGGITSNVATFVTDAAHNLLVGSQVEIVSVTGAVSPVGTHYVTAIPTTTSFSFALVGTDEIFTDFTAASLAKNIAFDTAQEVGGESSHMQTESEVAGHRHNLYGTADGQNNNYVEKSDFVSETSSVDNSRYSYAIRANSGNTDATVGLSSEIKNISGNDVTQTPTNNLQPYITTYIWKRTV